MPHSSLQVPCCFLVRYKHFLWTGEIKTCSKEHRLISSTWIHFLQFRGELSAIPDTHQIPKQNLCSFKDQALPVTPILGLEQRQEKGDCLQQLLPACSCDQCLISLCHSSNPTFYYLRMFPGFLLESSKSFHVWKKNSIILLASFVLSVSCALWHLSVTRSTCVCSPFTLFICLLILPLKYPFCKINTTCRQAMNLLPWPYSSVHCQMRAGPAEGPGQESIHSGCGVSSLWETSVFHQGFTSTCTSEYKSCPRETNTHNLCLQGTLNPSGNFENLALCSYCFSVLQKSETRNPAPSKSQCKYCWWFQWGTKNSPKPWLTWSPGLEPWQNFLQTQRPLKAVTPCQGAAQVVLSETAALADCFCQVQVHFLSAFRQALKWTSHMDRHHYLTPDYSALSAAVLKLLCRLFPPCRQWHSHRHTVPDPTPKFDAFFHKYQNAPKFAHLCICMHILLREIKYRKHSKSWFSCFLKMLSISNTLTVP